MTSESQQALLDYDDQSQGVLLTKFHPPICIIIHLSRFIQLQLRRDEIGQGETQESTLLNQKSDSMKTTTYGAADVARGAMGLAQGAANLAQGAATAMKNTFGSNSQNHTPLPTANPQN
ncbi:hypothetical protein L6452_23517 [Arctium lappa]|uniref:Uncharacterized protein n=1 Tax=Arctium lappa TaxID=4217 RepID=A0ACB9B260_ARCLA|nr:hypothetical protein L6452_23517 [Arctium lappa]